MKVEGKNGITAEVVQHSISETGKEIITFNVKYGLIVHAEQLRHRLLSNSVKSNRAVPTKKIREEVLKNPYVPVFLGKNKPGMSAAIEVNHKSLAEGLWKLARYPTCSIHWMIEKLGGHKEWSNRLLNPWQYVEQTITATEWANFYALRLHKDAQPDIQELARVMKEARDKSEPMLIYEDELHVPYVKRMRDQDGTLRYYDNSGKELNVMEALQASAARCARSSYNNHDKSDASYEKDKGLYHTLITSKPTHGSPCEHQATPFVYDDGYKYDRPFWEGWPKGVTHQDRNGDYWSGNLIGWVQARQLLEDHTVWEE